MTFMMKLRIPWKNTMEISIGKLETKTSYLHKIDINDVGIGDREIVICPQFFSPTCYLYIILLLQALLVWKKMVNLLYLLLVNYFRKKYILEKDLWACMINYFCNNVNCGKKCE